MPQQLSWQSKGLKIPVSLVQFRVAAYFFQFEFAKNEIPELAKKSDYCPLMSKTRQCLKTLNGGDLDTVQKFLDWTVLKNFLKF